MMLNAGMKTAHQVADALAAHLASSTPLADAAGAVPRVFLDAIGYDADLEDGRPVVYVHPESDDGMVRGDRGTVIRVVVGMDASAGVTGNAASSVQDSDGVYRSAQGWRLDAVANALVAKAADALPGAILDNADAEYDYSASPYQFSTITLTFTQIGTF